VLLFRVGFYVRQQGVGWLTRNCLLQSDWAKLDHPRLQSEEGAMTRDVAHLIRSHTGNIVSVLNGNRWSETYSAAIDGDCEEHTQLLERRFPIRLCRVL